MGMISKLDAINHMLLMAGESTVDNLDDLGGVDTGVCQGVLDRTLTDFQFRGLANNKFMKKFNLDPRGQVIQEPMFCLLSLSLIILIQRAIELLG